jgi:hypothetical protein
MESASSRSRLAVKAEWDRDLALVLAKCKTGYESIMQTIRTGTS